MEELNSISQEQPIKPNNNMPLAIIGTIIGLCSPCCIGLVVGIVAIVFGSQVNSKYFQNDYVGAESSAKNAKILAWVAIGLGILGLIITIVQIQLMGGIDAFVQQIQDAVEEAQNR